MLGDQMVAIFTGQGAGFDRGSASVLGGQGLLGSGAQGIGGDVVSLNAATGNLLINRQDEFLVGRGPDVSLNRTYNGLGQVADENGDRWRFNFDRRVYGLTGTANSAGSSIKRIGADGAEILYTWDASKTAYVAKDGGGAYDSLIKSGADWVWTDGDSRVTERYVSYGTTYGLASFRLVSVADVDGNSLTLTYSADKLSRIATADGSYVDYVWTGNNVTQLTTGYTDLAIGVAKTLVRTRYTYDAVRRALVRSLLSEAFGQGVINDIAFHAMSDRITTALESDQDTQRLWFAAILHQRCHRQLCVSWSASLTRKCRHRRLGTKSLFQSAQPERPCLRLLPPTLFCALGPTCKLTRLQSCLAHPLARPWVYATSCNAELSEKRIS